MQYFNTVLEKEYAPRFHLLFFLILLLFFLSGCVKNKDQNREKIHPQDTLAIRQGQEIFDKYCVSCHNFKKNGIGPNLNGVTAETSNEWLSSFIVNAPQMIDEGDARAVKLYEQYNQYMPAFPMLEKDEIRSLLAYIHSQQDTTATKEKKKMTGALKDPIPEKILSSNLTLILEEILTVPPSTDAPPLARINKLAAIESKGGNRLFVHDLRGKLYEIIGNEVHTYMNLPTEKQQFIDYPGLGTGFGSFAFHPDFKNNGFFYTTHTEPTGTAQADFPIPDSIPVALQWVLTEWKAYDGQARDFKGTHRELLRADMFSGIHGFQDIQFNPLAMKGDTDYGMLYLGVGEGGANLSGYPSWCHDKGKIWGTILRLDPLGKSSKNGKYGIPEDNLWAGGSDLDVLGEIWAYGFRNPHRFSWDLSGTKKMFITDIGEKGIEEVNLGIPGADYGWPFREGTFVLDMQADGAVYSLPPDDPGTYTYPVLQFDHDEGNAISGGYVYAGDSIPLLLDKYLFGDIVSGRLFYAENQEIKRGQQTEIYEIGFQINGKDTNLQTITKNKRVDLRFGMDGKKEIYILSKSNGAIYKIKGCKRKNTAF